MMRFHGYVEYFLSGTIPRDKEKILNKAIEELNNDFLLRGAKKREEAARIKDFKILNNRLILEIESGSRVRLHHAALRVKNFLSNLLGREMRIGIRGLTLHQAKIVIDTILHVSTKLPFVKNVYNEDSNTIIELEDLSESDIKRPIIDRLLKLLEFKERKLKWGGKIEHWRLIKQSEKKEPRFRDDPNIILEKIGWIKRYAPGQWLYTPPITYIIREFERLFYREVLKPLGFIEAIYPKINPLEIGVKTGHLKGTVHQMMFASQPIAYNPEDLEEWTDLVTVLEEAPPEELRKYTKAPSYFICFAQCEPFYWFFGGEIIDVDKLPMKWFDRSGPSFRWESGGLRGIERLVEFHRTEITWIGEPEQVIEIRNQLLEKYEYFMDKILDLEWRWAWVTPWFLVHAGEIEEETGEIDINQPGTIDFEAWLPYKGDRKEQNAWLEIGNISIHGTKYTSSFKIKHQAKDKIIWTGCSGFGVERWLLSFLAQKGFDPDNWPKKVREFITKPPSSVRTVTYPKTKEGKQLLDEIERLLSKLSGD